MTNDAHEEHPRSPEDFSRKEARQYLKGLLKRYRKYSTDLLLRENPALELVQIAQKAGYESAGFCPEHSDLEDYVLDPRSVAMAVHIGNCNSCYEELFEKG